MHDGTTPLILAARLAVEGMVEELINCHADVNAIDDFGKFFLFDATHMNNRNHYKKVPHVNQKIALDLNSLFLFLQVNQPYIGPQQ